MNRQCTKMTKSGTTGMQRCAVSDEEFPAKKAGTSGDGLGARLCEKAWLRRLVQEQMQQEALASHVCSSPDLADHADTNNQGLLLTCLRN